MKKTIIRTIGISSLMVAQLHFAVPTALASDAPVIITEIAAFEASGFEWIEIYNRSDETVDLTGWSFFEDDTHHTLTAFQNDLILEIGEHGIVADEADKFLEMTGFPGTIVDSSWSSLKETGEEIGIIDAGDTIIEKFTYIESPNTSLQRIDNEQF